MGRGARQGLNERVRQGFMTSEVIPAVLCSTKHHEEHMEIQ